VYAEERRQAIIERARKDGRADVSRLATELAVTPETIRRDLTVLDRRGLLRRVHGGAVPIERLGFEPQLATRAERLTEEKARIAKAALAEVPAEGAILLDAGSTTQYLAELLPHDRELTVITNGLPIALLLAGRPLLTVITPGGRVRGRTLAEVGAIALRTLEGFSIDVAFFGTNGISVEGGLTTPDLNEAEVKAAMCRRARRRVLLTDHTKVGRDTLCRFADVADLDVLITDAGLDDRLAEELESAGPTVVRT
jgi:DeoR family transcriptional regulator, fructose operon transcriptional repressor